MTTVFALAVGCAGWIAWTVYILWSIPSNFRILLDFNAFNEGWVEAIMFPLLAVFMFYALAKELLKAKPFVKDKPE